MFRREYQGGPHVEVFSAQGRDPAAQWKLTGSVKREYDKSVRGYIYSLEGGTSTTTTRMQLPKSDKTTLGLVQPWCVFQLLVPSSAKLAIDLSIVDEGGSRRRIHLSTSLRGVNATPLNARVPLADLHLDQWIHLCVGVASLVETLFKGSQYKTLEGISLGGSLRLRRIFTLLNSPAESENEVGLVAAIPRALLITSVNIKTQILDSNTLHSCITSGNPSSSTELRPTHVAFGKTVAIPDHILHSRQQQQHQASSDGESTEPTTVGHPRPPSTPAEQPVLRVRRARVRMVSDKSSSKSRMRESQSSVADQEVSRSTGQVESQESSQNVPVSTGPRNTVPSNDQNKKVATHYLDRNSEATEEQIYSYRSAPKSAERQPNPIQLSTMEESSSARGARLQDDFLSSSQSHHTALDTHRELEEQNTRLSDDYDWRQYVSAADTIGDSDASLRTRLASKYPHTSPHVDTITSGYEDTLSESMTLSGLTEHVQDGQQKLLLDSTETKDMGGLLSPAILDDNVDQPQSDASHVSVSDSAGIKADEIELMYDPHLNCFYDPITCKYYELLQSD